MSSMFTNNKPEIVVDNALQVGVVYVDGKPKVVPITDRTNLKYKILYYMLLSTFSGKTEEEQKQKQPVYDEFQQYFTTSLNDNLTVPRDHENFENYNSILKRSYLENDLFAYYQYVNGLAAVVDKVEYQRPIGEGIKDLNIEMIQKNEDDEYEEEYNDNNKEKKDIGRFGSTILIQMQNHVLDLYRNDEYVKKIVKIANGKDDELKKTEMRNLLKIFNGKQFVEHHKASSGEKFIINYIKSENDNNEKNVSRIDFPYVGSFNSKEIDTISKNMIKCHKDMYGERRYYWFDRVKGVVMSSNEDIFDGKEHNDIDVYFKTKCKGKIEMNDVNKLELKFKQINKEKGQKHIYSFLVDTSNDGKYRTHTNMLVNASNYNKEVEIKKNQEKIEEYIKDIKKEIDNIHSEILSNQDIEKVEITKHGIINKELKAKTKISDNVRNLNKKIDDLKSFLMKNKGLKDREYGALLDEAKDRYWALVNILVANHRNKDKKLTGDKEREFNEKFIKDLKKIEVLIKEDCEELFNEFLKIGQKTKEGEQENHLADCFFHRSGEVLSNTLGFVDKIKENWPAIKKYATDNGLKNENELKRLEEDYRLTGQSGPEGYEMLNLKNEADFNTIWDLAGRYKPEIFEDVEKEKVNMSCCVKEKEYKIRKKDELLDLTKQFFETKKRNIEQYFDKNESKRVILLNNGHEFKPSSVGNMQDEYNDAYEEDEAENDYKFDNELVCDIYENKDNISQQEGDFAEIARKSAEDDDKTTDYEEGESKDIDDEDTDIDEDDRKKRKDNKSKQELQKEAEIATLIANNEEKKKIQEAINTLNELAEKDWFDKFCNWLSSFFGNEDEFQRRYQNAAKFLMETDFKTITNDNEIFKEALNAIKKAENNLWDLEPIKYNSGRLKEIENRNLIPYELVEKKRKPVDNGVSISLNSGRGRGRE